MTWWGTALDVQAKGIGEHESQIPLTRSSLAEGFLEIISFLHHFHSQGTTGGKEFLLQLNTPTRSKVTFFAGLVGGITPATPYPKPFLHTSFSSSWGSEEQWSALTSLPRLRGSWLHDVSRLQHPHPVDTF